MAWSTPWHACALSMRVSGMPIVKHTGIGASDMPEKARKLGTTLCGSPTSESHAQQPTSRLCRAGSLRHWWHVPGSCEALHGWFLLETPAHVQRLTKQSVPCRVQTALVAFTRQTTPTTRRRPQLTCPRNMSLGSSTLSSRPFPSTSPMRSLPEGRCSSVFTPGSGTCERGL